MEERNEVWFSHQIFSQFALAFQMQRKIQTPTFGKAWIWLVWVFFYFFLCLSLWNFRLEESMHRGPWLAYVPLCQLGAWEPIERLTRSQPKHFTVKPYYHDQYWWLVTCCRFTSPLYVFVAKLLIYLYEFMLWYF